MSEHAVPDDAIPGTTIRFFLSSTFRDFQIERTVLQQQVFPPLRRLCAGFGFRFQPIDLRWGVSEAAGTDRQTLRICFDELLRCRALSPDCFLLIQLGERYGSSLLPPQVPAALIERLLPHLHPEERERFEAAYRLDGNAVPAEYVLLRAEGAHDAADEQVRLALVRAGQTAGVGEAERLLFDGSATHGEIQLGLLGAGVPPESSAASGVLCAVRTFTGEQVGPAVATYAAEDAERAERVRQLTDAVLARLPEKQVLRYTVAWEGEVGPAFEKDRLASAYMRLLWPKLEAVITARMAARAAAEAEGRDAVALANAAFEAERATEVEGRDTELARLAAYLAGETGADVPLVVTGVGGSGKSTLLAEAATRAARSHPEAALLVRYCGVTPRADTPFSLLNGLHQAIARAYGEPEPDDILDETTLLSSVASDLATRAVPPARPLLLVIDALDQLSPIATPTDWLPRQLAPGVRVVVSVLAARPELSALRSWLPAEQVVTLGPLSVAAGQALLRDLLMEPPARTLTAAQEEAVLTAFAHEGLPLYLRLVADVARRWRAFDPPHLGPSPQEASAQQPALPGTLLPEPALVESPGLASLSPEGSFLPPHASALPQTVGELLAERLTQLEAPERYGTALAAHALGDLAATRVGLAEDELLDLLARDPAVRDAQQVLAPASPPIDPELPFPVALWARLEAELTALLATHVAGDGTLLVTFYDRQLREAVQARYLAGAAGVERHQALAEYFAAQRWQLSLGGWNWRKVDEEVVQREGANDRLGAEQALESLAAELEARPSLPDADARAIVALVDALFDRLHTEGYWRVAERLYQQQLLAQRALGNRSGEGTALGNLGLLAAHLGQPEEAHRYYEEALAILREVGNRRDEGTVLGNLGGLARTEGQPEEARRYYEQALTIAREVGDRSGEETTLYSLRQLALALDKLGLIADHLGQPEKACRFLEEALAIFEEIKAEENALRVRAHLADLEAQHAQGISAPTVAAGDPPAPAPPAPVSSIVPRDAPPLEEPVPEPGPAGEQQRRRWWPFGR
jgi:NACHT domain- and WD repeat-containing protein